MLIGHQNFSWFTKSDKHNKIWWLLLTCAEKFTIFSGDKNCYYPLSKMNQQSSVSPVYGLNLNTSSLSSSDNVQNTWSDYSWTSHIRVFGMITSICGFVGNYVCFIAASEMPKSNRPVQSFSSDPCFFAYHPEIWLYLCWIQDW